MTQLTTRMLYCLRSSQLLQSAAYHWQSCWQTCQTLARGLLHRVLVVVVVVVAASMQAPQHFAALCQCRTPTNWEGALVPCVGRTSGVMRDNTALLMCRL